MSPDGVAGLIRKRGEKGRQGRRPFLTSKLIGGLDGTEPATSGLTVEHRARTTARYRPPLDGIQLVSRRLSRSEEILGGPRDNGGFYSFGRPNTARQTLTRGRRSG